MHICSKRSLVVSGIAVATTCIMIVAKSIHSELGGRMPIVTVLKGILVVASELRSIMCYYDRKTPILFDPILTIAPSMPNIVDLALIPYHTVTFAYNIRAWDVLKITAFGCTTLLLANGVRISYDRLADGTIIGPDSNGNNCYTVYAIAKGNFDL